MNKIERNSPQNIPNVQYIAFVLFSKIRQLIDVAKQRAAVAINAEIILLH